MRVWSQEHVFDHPWDTVVHAAWRKYPNPLKPEVVGLDVLDRKVDSNGILHTDRILTTEWHIPSWVTRLIGLSNPNHSYEHSEVDRKTKRMVLQTRNLNCTNFVSVDETLIYRPHPDHPDKTLLEQSTVVSVRGIPLINYMEDTLASTMSKNANKGRQAMEWVIDNIKKEYEGFSKKILTEFNELTQQQPNVVVTNPS
jgi:hypothetical protein